ncbi:MAG TPA: outer membrane protein assembly factor BamA [Desulfobacteraceae bacterium]|nr:outer membrane protein assembly factor BamA [Desulfobacteraceae bacterium]
MKKITIGFGLAISLFLSCITVLQAQEQVSVAVFPFEVQAAAPNSQVKTVLPQMLKDKLEKDGAKVVLTDTSLDVSDWGYPDFRREGIRLGVDWIILGHVFISGQRMSIDSTMYSVYEDRAPFTYFSQAPNMGGLFGAVSSLSKDIIGQLFQKQIISDIRITGNKRIESDAISRVIKTQTGELLNPESLSSDLHLIYKMGYFDDVVVKKETLDRGVAVEFQVAEKPSVRNIKFADNSVYEDEELSQVVSTSTGSILNVYKINSDVEKIKRLYFEKNYHNCRITYDIKPLKNDQADIIFTINEGEKIRIESIVFDGNHHFSDDDIKDVMQTQEKGFWSFLTLSGNLDETELDNDVIRIESLYKNNGFINVKVSDADINLGNESITISFKIEEGDQYKTGKVEVTGDILTSEADLLALLKSEPKELYNRELIRKDMITLSDLYSNDGYANVKVSPLVNRDEEAKTVNIIFNIAKGELVYFNRITITGNAKTKDKIIRRELGIEEQGRYSMKGLQRSYRNLAYKDYFENIDIQPVKTDKPNQRDVEVKVTEKSTGNFSFGGGFSSDDGPFGMFSVEERNLLGNGQHLKFMARLSGENGLFTIGFTEPWMFDRPVSAGFDIYKSENEYDHYDKDAMGLTLRSSYRKYWDYTTVGIKYNIEDFEIYDVDSSNTNVVEGDYLSSSITPYISYDSRDHRFLPTTGMFHKISYEYAGEFVGGEIDFSRLLAETAYFFPLFSKVTGAVYAKGGLLWDNTDNDINIDWEKFYLGGINSIRGYDNTDINGTSSGSSIEEGGEKYVQFNLEMIFPLQEDAGVYGVLFFDAGDVANGKETIDFGTLYSSSGFELRWNSPMGPIRLAYGVAIDGQDVKDTGEGQFDFSIGAFF